MASRGRLSTSLNSEKYGCDARLNSGLLEFSCACIVLEMVSQLGLTVVVVLLNPN